MTLNSYYQFQIPEAEITFTTYFALRPFNIVESLFVLVRCCCLCLSLPLFGCCFVFSFLNI